MERIVDFSVLNNEEDVGTVVSLLDILVVCSTELSSSNVGKVELVSSLADVLLVRLVVTAS